MPRRPIPFLPDQYYHFYNRGNNRQAVFFERDNYLYFLRGLKKYVCNYVDIIAYSLMPTHYHILGMVKNQNSEVSEASDFSTSEPLTSETQTSEVLETSEVSQAKATSKAVSLAMQSLEFPIPKPLTNGLTVLERYFRDNFKESPSSITITCSTCAFISTPIP